FWSDGRASLTPDEAHLHYRAILDEYHRNPTLSPEAIGGLVEGAGQHLQVLNPEHYPPAHENQSTLKNDRLLYAELNAAIAFGCRGQTRRSGQRGYAERNREQRLFFRTPSGTMRCVPLTITSLALETIFRSTTGDTLKI